MKLFGKRDDPGVDIDELHGRFFQLVEQRQCFSFGKADTQFFDNLIIVDSDRPILSVQLRQFGHVFQRSAIGFITRNTSPKTRALIKAAFDNNPDCSYIVRNRACSSAEKFTEKR